MRLYGIQTGDVVAVVWDPARTNLDQRGNRRLTGTGRDDLEIIVVIAGDDPDFVITTFPDD